MVFNKVVLLYKFNKKYIEVISFHFEGIISKGRSHLTDNIKVPYIFDS